MKKGFIKKLSFFMMAVAFMLSFSACTSERFTSSEACEWCGDTPTKAYITSENKKCYVCKECATHCAWCDKKADKHYTNLLGLEVFVCDDCYKSINDN